MSNDPIALRMYTFEDALCVQRPELPWTTDPEHASAEDTRTMLGLCRRCPLFGPCDDLLLVDEPDSGFFAGQWAEVVKDPAYHTRAPAVMVSTAAINASLL